MKMDVYDKSLELHEKYKGKISIKNKWGKLDKETLALAYTPGVAEACRKISENRALVYNYTCKSNTIAVVSDGSAVLGLGNIGAEAAIPVMEGKAVLFKEFANVDAFPICIKSNDVEEIIKTIKLISPVFAGINLEDISAPRCFEIESRLREELNIPVFHDDQHGTAVVVLAALINALKVANKENHDVRIVINGAGAAGIAIAKILLSQNIKDIVVCDSKGVISQHRTDLNKYKTEISKMTNKGNIKGTLSDALRGSDVFIGVSVAGVLRADDVKNMKPKPIIFALANPVPEIMPGEAQKAGVFIIATGRSDYPNQINNVLGFPGIFRGVLNCRAKEINEEMKTAAAYALAKVAGKDLNVDRIIPTPFEIEVVNAVSDAVEKAAVRTGVAKWKN
jgi:malate dehydrogenase (oxaloacetate-decarboxylating)